MPPTPAQTCITLAYKLLANALSDHYINSKSPLSQEEYWKSHLGLTGVKTVDSWLQSKVNNLVNPGLVPVDDFVRDFVRGVKRELGI
jgi:hypothetical protein